MHRITLTFAAAGLGLMLAGPAAAQYDRQTSRQDPSTQQQWQQRDRQQQQRYDAHFDDRYRGPEQQQQRAAQNRPQAQRRGQQQMSDLQRQARRNRRQLEDQFGSFHGSQSRLGEPYPSTTGASDPTILHRTPRMESDRQQNSGRQQDQQAQQSRQRQDQSQQQSTQQRGNWNSNNQEASRRSPRSNREANPFAGGFNFDADRPRSTQENGYTSDDDAFVHWYDSDEDEWVANPDGEPYQFGF